MILRQLYLKIGDLGLPTEFTYGFLKRSRYICNHIEREVLAKLRFRTENFNRIVVSACSKPGEGAFVNAANAACVDVPYERNEYERLTGGKLGLYYVGLLREGLEKCAVSVPVPKGEIFEGLDAFVAGGMTNEWTHKQRLFRKEGIRATLKCAMTQDAFTLRISVQRGERVACDRKILTTDPDENAFGYRFKDIAVEGRNLVVTSKHGAPLWSKLLSGLKG